MIPYADIESEAKRLNEEVIGLRRDFHRHPELGFEEHRTASRIASYLKALGLEVKDGIARTGVSALLRGALPGRTVMLRADMDALPVREQTGLEYQSVNEGVMHACGHDGHMAILLGTAALLKRLQPSMNGQVRFVFQPAEENLGGARLMIEEGILEDPRVDAAFGLHLIGILPFGWIATRKGPFMAAMDTFTIRVLGTGGHSAMPDGSVDAVSLSAYVVMNMSAHIRNALPEGTPLIVNIGTISGGTAPNIVADAVELSGTVRTLDEDVRLLVRELMEDFLRRATSERRGGYELVYEQGYPATVNDGAMTDLVMEVAREVAGGDSLIDLPPSMASEDMSFYLRAVPGCFFFVGAGSTDAAKNTPHHNPRFTIDERSMELGVRMLSSVALRFLDG